MGKESIKIIANNKKAYHDYFVEETYEAGIVLVGTEVKSVRGGKVSLSDSYVTIDDGEVILRRMHISPYEKGNIFNRDPIRNRKLLLNRREILKLKGKTTTPGYTIIPLQVYIKGNLVKVQIGLCKGKKLYDKRETIAKKDARRELERKYSIKNLR